MSAVVRQLPLVRWASRFSRGVIELTGTLPDAVTLLDGTITLTAGPVAGRLDWVGGATPAVEAAAVDAATVAWAGHHGATLAVGPGVASLDGRAVPMVRMDRLFDELLDHLHDVAVRAEATSERELLVKVAKGVEATLPAREKVVVTGMTSGPPTSPLLDAPFVVTVGGTGVRVSHRRLKWLSSLARVRLVEASLHPDGKVDLQGDALGRRMRGLQRVSERLSDVVRQSPRFARVRKFLRPSAH